MSGWRLTRLNGEFCITWADGDVRRRYRLGTTDPAEAARRAPSRFAELTRPRGTTVAAMWGAYTLDMQGRAVVTTMQHTWKALKDRFGALEADKVSIADCRAHTAARRAGRL